MVDVRTDGPASMTQQGTVIPLQAVRDTWSIQEFKDAFNGLDEAEHARLVQAVALFARIARMEPIELLQEAVTRVLEGRRRWFRDLSLAVFLVGAARSVASGEKRYRERGEVRSPVSVYGGDGNVEYHGEEESGSPEDETIAKEQASIIEAEMEALFADDVAAWTIYSGYLDGLKGEELRREVDLGPIEFATKRRLVRRRLNIYCLRKGERS